MSFINIDINTFIKVFNNCPVNEQEINNVYTFVNNFGTFIANDTKNINKDIEFRTLEAKVIDTCANDPEFLTKIRVVNGFFHNVIFASQIAQNHNMPMMYQDAFQHQTDIHSEVLDTNLKSELSDSLISYEEIETEKVEAEKVETEKVETEKVEENLQEQAEKIVKKLCETNGTSYDKIKNWYKQRNQEYLKNMIGDILENRMFSYECHNGEKCKALKNQKCSFLHSDFNEMLNIKGERANHCRNNELFDYTEHTRINPLIHKFAMKLQEN